MRSIQLKIKAVSLATEAAIIRHYEHRELDAARYAEDTLANISPASTLTNVQLERIKKRALAARGRYVSVSNHRKVEVRRVSRSTHLARAFLAGVPYSRVEAFAYDEPNWGAISAMVLKYGEGDVRDRMQSFGAWKADPDAKVQNKPKRDPAPVQQSD